MYSSLLQIFSSLVQVSASMVMFLHFGLCMLQKLHERLCGWNANIVFSFSCHYFDTNEKCCTVKLCDCYPKWSLPKQAKLWVFHVYNATNRVCPHDKLTGEVIQFVCKWNLLSVTKDNLDFPFRCKSSLSGSGLREFFPKFRSKEFDEPVRYFHKVPGRWPRRSF